MIPEINEIFVYSLRARQRWYSEYYREFKDEFIPKFRRFYQRLLDYQTDVDPGVNDMACELCNLALTHLWYYEIYCTRYETFLYDFRHLTEHVIKQYEIAIGKKISWPSACTDTFL